MKRPTPAMAVAVLALFVVLGGTGYAVSKLPKNSVGTAQLRKNAVTAAKIRDGAVGGADVNEATLGKVPTASRADSAARADGAARADTAGRADSAGTADKAGDASTLGGLAPSAFLRADGIYRFGDLVSAHGENGKTVATINGVRFFTSCQTTFAEFGVGIDAPGNNIMISSGNTSQGPVSSGYFLTAQDNKFSASEFGILTNTGVHMHGVWSAAEDPFGINGCRHGGYVIVDSP
jgi:hypothetical protein